MSNSIYDDLPQISSVHVNQKSRFSKRFQKDIVSWVVVGYTPTFQRTIYLGTFETEQEAEEFKKFIMDNADLDTPAQRGRSKAYNNLYTKIRMKPKV